MKPIRTFTVTPSLPSSLEDLRTLAFNLRWAWNHDAIELFRRLDNELWETTGHNPVLMLGTIDQARLEAVTADDGFLDHLRRVSQDLNAYRAGQSTWFRRAHGATPQPLVAYFSAEFGVTECLSIFLCGRAWLATRLGAGAVAALARGQVGVLVGMTQGRITSTSLADIVDIQKSIDPELFELAKVLEK